MIDPAELMSWISSAPAEVVDSPLTAVVNGFVSDVTLIFPLPLLEM